MSKKVSNHIGLIGCGSWGKYILRDLVSLKCQTWVVARSKQSYENAKSLNAHNIVNSLKGLPSDLDAYIVAVPTSEHAQIIFELIERNKPIFTEKPLTNSIKDAEKILSEADGLVFVMDKWRYHPAINALKELINSSELGKVSFVSIRRLGWGNPHDDVDSMWVLLPHDFSIVLHLLGEIPAINWAVSHDPLHFTGITISLGKRPGIIIETSSKSIIRDRSVQINFEDGSAIMSDPYCDHIQIMRGTGNEKNSIEIEKKEISTEMPLLLELKSFIEYLNGGPEPYSSVKDSVSIVKSILRARDIASING